MEGTESVTSLENLFNGPAATNEPATPVETPPPEPAPNEPAPTGEPNPAPPAEEHEDPQVRAFKAKAIDEGKKRQRLEQDLAEAQRQNAEYQRYLQQLHAQQQQRQQQAPQQQAQPQELHPSQFSTYEEYLRAEAKHAAKEEAKRELQEAIGQMSKAQREEQERRQQAFIQQQTAADVTDMLTAGQGKYEDFQRVAASMPLSDPMMNAALVLDNGHDVIYHLGMNPAEAARIYQLPPSSQAREIAKIAKQIAVPLQPPVAVPPPPVAAVPPVVAPELPKTLTQTRSAGGQFTKTWTGPTPLDQVVRRK
jgi:hypothetical protein